MDNNSDEARARWTELVAAAGHDPHLAAVSLVQQVSDVVKGEWGREHAPANFAPFILPAAVDPLDAVFDALPCNLATCVDASTRFREELAKCGLTITPA